MGSAAWISPAAQLRQINVFLDLDKLYGYNLTAQDVQRAVADGEHRNSGRPHRAWTDRSRRPHLGPRRASCRVQQHYRQERGGAAHSRCAISATPRTAWRRSAPSPSYKGKPAVVARGPPADRNQYRPGGGCHQEAAGHAAPRSCRPGVNVEVVKDQATYIKASVKSLEEHLVLGSLLASLIVWLFIRNWRTVLISSIAIPTSIITTFTLIRAMDFTLNSMTLLGLTLAVGIVIDDAIIVLENIYRYIDEKDMPPMQAAVAATKEIALAVMATTLSLVIIFVPIAFMTGYARRFVNQFGWTMAMSIMVSMLVAFTLTPTLSARLLKKKTPQAGRKPSMVTAR